MFVNGNQNLPLAKRVSTFSGAGFENLIEPIFAVPLNDELQQAKFLVAKSEEHVLSELTDKVIFL